MTKTRDQRRVDFAFALLILAGTVALTLMALWIQSLSHDLRIANDSRDALARQVEQLGGKPVAGPPGSRGEPGKSVVGPRGPSGPPGPSGSPGRPGKDGKDGSDGTDGTSATGDPGAPGASGAPGVPGPAGPQGDPGPAGPPGPAGADGKDGKDGQTCPDGYSMQTPSYDQYALVCRQDSAPDPVTPSPTTQAAALDPARRTYA